MFLLRCVLLTSVMTYALRQGATSVQVAAVMAVTVALVVVSQQLLGPLWLSLGSRRRRADERLLAKAVAATEQVADALGAATPRVLLLPGSNAVWVRGSSRRVLGIGRRWVRDMTPHQLAGVVAHEFGHDDRRFFEQQAAVLAGEVLAPSLAALVGTALLLASGVLAAPTEANWRAVALLGVTWAAARLFHLVVVLPRRRAEELAADDFAVDHGFGPHLADALSACRSPARPRWATTHPPVAVRRARVARRLGARPTG